MPCLPIGNCGNAARGGCSCGSRADATPVPGEELPACTLWFFAVLSITSYLLDQTCAHRSTNPELLQAHPAAYPQPSLVK
jgi:hypothetical protein